MSLQKPANEADRERVHRVYLRDAMRTSHECQNALLEELRNVAHTNDVATIDPVWTEFERSLRTHFALEEREFLPEFARSHLHEAERIRAEHRVIERAVAELGVSLELHQVREGQINALIDAIRIHGETEDGLLYRWIDEHMDEARKPGLLDRLNDAIEKVEGSVI